MEGSGILLEAIRGLIICGIGLIVVEFSNDFDVATKAVGPELWTGVISVCMGLVTGAVEAGIIGVGLTIFALGVGCDT